MPEGFFSISMWLLYIKYAFPGKIFGFQYRQFPLYIKVQFLKLLHNPKFTHIIIEPTPNYLSHLISYVYISTVPMYMFKMLFLSVFFLHMKYIEVNTFNNYSIKN